MASEVIYEGKSGGVITVNGKLLLMTKSARQASLTGFSWGYAGSGCYATAHSILAHAFGVKVADRRAMEFKFDVIAKFPFGGAFRLSKSEIKAWLADHDIPAPATPEAVGMKGMTMASERICTRCNGVGYTGYRTLPGGDIETSDCKWCGGTGRVAPATPEAFVCTNCEGSGTVIGAGAEYMPCMRCNGTGVDALRMIEELTTERDMLQARIAQLEAAIQEAIDSLKEYTHGGAQYMPDILHADSTLRQALAAATSGAQANESEGR